MTQIRKTLVILILLVPLSGFAQVDHQLWLDYNVNVPVNTRFSYGGDIGFRGFVSNIDWNQIYLRPQVRYRFNSTFMLAGGIASFNTFNNVDENVNEFRINEDINIRWPDFGVLSLIYRLRFEHRFFYYPTLPNNSKTRVRYLAGFETQDFRLGEGKRPFYFQGMWEGFKTIGTENAYEIYINQVRVKFIFAHRLSNKIRYELHYIAQKSRQFSDEGLETTQNIIRVRLFHRISKK